MTQRVKFTWHGQHEADVVSVAGTFSNWEPVELHEVPGGNMFSAFIDYVEEGKHFFHFLVDGNEELDDTQPKEDYDEKGQKKQKNVVIVGRHQRGFLGITKNHPQHVFMPDKTEQISEQIAQSAANDAEANENFAAQ